VSAVAEPVVPPASRIAWPAIFAGAIGAAGVSFALHAFAVGIGLAVASTAPTWRDSSAALWFLSGLYLLFVALAAFGFGGYIAGRMRAPLGIETREAEFVDGMHGLVTWALAIVFTALLALGLAATAAPAAAPGGGNTGASQSVAGENIIASELDELFWSDRPIPDLTYRRAEAARVLLKSSSHNGVPQRDRDYLTAVVSSETQTPPDAARERVDHAITASRDELHRARSAGVLQAFFIAVALFVGAAVAWFAACEGGREREARVLPLWDWSFRRRDYTRRGVPRPL
jgi:hypothetical protein